MFIQVAVNGSGSRLEHPKVPITPEEVASDAVACAQAGASALHVHPRNSEGEESLDPNIVAAVCEAIRSRTDLPIGLTTELSITSGPEQRLQLVQRWSTLPDFATVNVSEEGWLELARWFLGHGVGVEAGVWTPSDARRLAESGLDRELTRILVEPIGLRALTALESIDQLHEALDHYGLTAPRLQHTEDESGWLVLGDALSRGLQTRVGLEDLLTLSDGTPAEDNAHLVRHVVQLAGA